MNPNRGLSNVLFVRIDDEMDALLGLAVEGERERNPGKYRSKADVVREILAEALVREPRPNSRTDELKSIVRERQEQRSGA